MNLLDMIPSQAERHLAEWVAEQGQPQYRVRQIFPRLWQRPVRSWSDCTDLPKTLIELLERDFPLPGPRLRERQESSDGTVKYLWEMSDGDAVESVVLLDGKRRTLCLSSQVGCAYGCAFCATGQMGFVRNLLPWEITAQVRELHLDPSGPVIQNVVFMGMGEPLHNWPAVDVALTILNDQRGLGIGARRITVSTVGVLPKLLKLAQRPEQFRLALSLHTPFSDRRRQLMPVERSFPLERVLETIGGFARRVTFEYVLIEGFNDRKADADELARIARPLGALVNLLPLHPGGAAGLKPTKSAAIQRFAASVRTTGVNVTVRKSRGLDIAAACGQLWTNAARRSQVAADHDGDIEQQ